MGAGILKNLRYDGLKSGRIMQNGIREGRPGTPSGILAVVKESDDAVSCRTDMQLKIQTERGLIPRGVTDARGVTQNGTGLSKLLESVQGCRMSECSQGTVGSECAWRTGG